MMGISPGLDMGLVEVGYICDKWRINLGDCIMTLSSLALWFALLWRFPGTVVQADHFHVSTL